MIIRYRWRHTDGSWKQEDFDISRPYGRKQLTKIVARIRVSKDGKTHEFFRLTEIEDLTEVEEYLANFDGCGEES